MLREQQSLVEMPRPSPLNKLTGDPPGSVNEPRFCLETEYLGTEQGAARHLLQFHVTARDLLTEKRKQTHPGKRCALLEVLYKVISRWKAGEHGIVLGKVAAQCLFRQLWQLTVNGEKVVRRKEKSHSI